MKIIGIIPARSGSVGIKEKNIRKLCWTPLYEWTTKAAISSNCFDKIVISTNIADILDGFYAEYTQRRPRDLCLAGITTQQVVRHVLSVNKGYDAFGVLQPTSPFIRTQDIKDCIKLLKEMRVDSAQTIRPIKHLDHAYNQRKFDSENKVVTFAFPEKRKDVRKQKQPKHFAYGNFFATRTKYFLETNDFWGRSAGVVIDWFHGIDIDYEEDLKLADAVYQGGLLL